MTSIVLLLLQCCYFVNSDRYPYFTANDDKWKNSVRHNLSMNPHFRKGNKSKHGAGHLWVLADFDEHDQDDGLHMSTGVRRVTTIFRLKIESVKKLTKIYK